MGEFLLLVLVLNSLLFSFIFWLLTFLCKFFYQDKYSSYKLNFYECGFKSVSNVKISFTLQFILLACFLLIYDSEFLLLFPIMFNVFHASYLEILTFFFFMFWLVLALVVDYCYSALDWSL